MNYVTVAQLAKQLGVTPQGINKFMREQGLQSQAVKKGNKFLIGEQLAETIRNHFSPDHAEISETQKQTDLESETIETDIETTETNGNNKTPDQSVIYLDYIEELKHQLEIKDEQLKNAEIEKQKLHDEIARKDDQIERLDERVRTLIETNRNLSLPKATQALEDAKEILEIQPHDQNSADVIQEQKESESADASKPGTDQPQKKKGFWARLFGL